MIESNIVVQQFDHINWCSPNQKQNFVLESISRSSPWNKEAQHWGPMRKQERDKKAKILKKEFRESCNDVFNRPDEEISWKYMQTITKSSLSPTN